MNAWDIRESDVQPGDYTLTDGCATGNPAMLDLNPAGTGNRRARADLLFDLPRGARIVEYRLNRAIRAAASVPGFVHTYVAAVHEGGLTTEDWGCASALLLPYFNCSMLGSPTDPADPGNQWTRSGLDLNRLSVWVGCISNGCAAPFQAPSAFFHLWQSQVTVEDLTHPTIVTTGGTLIGPEPVDRKANLFVQARDSISGIKAMALEIDGQPSGTIQVDSGSCAEPYEVTRPCPEETGRIFTVDTAGLSEGPHTATGTVTDAAGNQTAFGPLGFTVERPGPPDPQPENGIPAVNEPVIRLGTGAVWHRPGKAAAIAGRLLTDAGVPVAGATLGVRSTPLGVRVSRSVNLPDVLTGADGKFRIPVRGNGARRIEITFAPGADRPVTSSSVVPVRSRLSLTLRPRPRKVRIGKRVTFTGRIKGAGPSSIGVPVEIQAKVAGRWETVASVRTRAGGNWRWRYRFRFVERRAIFSFRALVSSAPGWPWPQVKSPVRKVRITMKRR